MRGDPRALRAEPRVGVVGSRAGSPSALHVAREIGRGLAAAGVVVVSGLARGVDGAAHEGALTAGQTVAVVGCGADVDYPFEHRGLAARVAATGAIVSELPPGTAPHRFHFPLRNRLISGLCRGVVVVEASSLYVQMKYDLQALLPERDSSEFHAKLYEHAKMNVLRIIRQGANADMRVPLPLGDHPGMPCMNPFWGIERKLVYTLSARAPFGSQPNNR